MLEGNDKGTSFIREQMKSVDFYMLKTQVQTRIRWFIQILV